MGTEFNQQITGQCQSVVLLEQKSHPAFSGLTVHPHRFFVGTANIFWIDGQIRYFPTTAIDLGHAFLNCILMRTGKRGKDQLSRIGMTFVHRKLSHRFGYFTNFRHVTQI